MEPISLTAILTFLSPIVGYVLYRLYAFHSRSDERTERREEQAKEQAETLKEDSKKTPGKASEVNESIDKQKDAGRSWEEEMLNPTGVEVIPEGGKKK